MKLSLLLVPVLVLFGSCERHSLEETAPAREFENHSWEKIEATKGVKKTGPAEEKAHF
ncbi:MAG TPA: hypothetical protein VIT21_03995 [Chthoniobacterales bacterium]